LSGVRLLGIVAVLLASALFAGSAEAATVSFAERECDPRYGNGCNAYVEFFAVSGERNDVVVRSSAQSVVVADRSAPLSAGSKCRATGPNEVTCPPGFPIIAMGDGPDRVEVVDGVDGYANGSTSLRGGAGDDVLVGGSFRDAMSGGPGVDRLMGASGYDYLSDESVEPDAGDVLDGGPGIDTAAYASRRVPVHVTLDPAGESRNEDRLTGVESLVGGRSNDVLTGDAGPNSLVGGGGDDRLAGEAGDDRLQGGSGRDRLDGGDGDDVLTPIVFQGNNFDYAEADRDHVRCGQGADRIEWTRSDDLIDPTCEIVRPGFPEEFALAQRLTQLTSPVARLVETFCAYDRCRPVITMRVASGSPRRRLAPPGTLLGRRVIPLGMYARARDVPLRLSRRGRAALRRYGRLRVVVSFTEFRGQPPGDQGRFALILKQDNASPRAPR